jgi:TRAP-type C4-dicarboxylate transport system permease small subunit
VRALRGLAAAAGTGLFAALFLVFLVQISARFVFNRPLPWTDEAAVFLYVWVILWTAALIVPEREHVAFDLVWNLVGARARRAMRAIGLLAVGVLAAWAVPASWDYARFMGREGSAVLGLPLSWLYAPFVLLLVALAARAAIGLWQLCKGESSE